MRFFPSARRLRACNGRAVGARVPGWIHPQWFVVYLATVLAVAGLMMPVARADDTDDLKKRQKQVEGQIDHATDDLQESSRRVARVSRTLDQARTELAGARSRLTRVRGDLADARKLTAQLTRKLERAEKRFALAVADLKAAREEVALQREETRDTVINMVTGGDPELSMISSYLDSGSVEEIMINETGNGVVVNRQHRVLDGLVKAEEAMEDQRDEVREARNEVALRKEAADENLAHVKTLMIQAEKTRDRVSHLVVRTREARDVAVRARAKDKAALKRLEAREARIREEILAASRKEGRTYNGATDGLLNLPSSGPITSPYGYRTHPIYGYYGLHNGTDFGAACGSALWAGAAGTVVNTYYDEVYGNRLYLAIGRINGAVITLVYNHLSRYAVGEGARVGRGDVVGYAGSTGWSTGCHLHFTVLRNGSPVDPMGYL